jgi:hypothetical protein
VSAINFACDVSPIIPGVNGGASSLGKAVPLPGLYLVPKIASTGFVDDLIKFSRGQVFAKYDGPIGHIGSFKHQITSNRGDSGEMLMFDGRRAKIQDKYPMAEVFENGRLTDPQYHVFVKSNEYLIRVGGCYTYQHVPVCVNMLIFRRRSLFSYSDLAEQIGYLKSILDETGGASQNPLFHTYITTRPLLRKYGERQGSGGPDNQLTTALAHCVSLQDSLDRVLLWALDGDQNRRIVILGIHITASIRKEDGSVEIVGPVYTRLARPEA